MSRKPRSSEVKRHVKCRNLSLRPKLNLKLKLWRLKVKGNPTGTFWNSNVSSVKEHWSSQGFESEFTCWTWGTVQHPSLAISEDPEAPVDIVKLWEPGARERYYVSKFNIKVRKLMNRQEGRSSHMSKEFCWVLAYYYRGCPSWKWFYLLPLRPICSWFSRHCPFEHWIRAGEPFRPFDQLMAVFPAASREYIPPAFHHLMTNHDSDIIDFYPEDFLIDYERRRPPGRVSPFAFIEEKRLLEALEAVYPDLTDVERDESTWKWYHLHL